MKVYFKSSRSCLVSWMVLIEKIRYICHGWTLLETIWDMLVTIVGPSEGNSWRYYIMMNFFWAPSIEISKYRIEAVLPTEELPPVKTTPLARWRPGCYLVRRLCFIIKRFSSVGYICTSAIFSASLDPRPRFFFLLPGWGGAAATTTAAVPPSHAGRFDILCFSGTCFDFLNLFLFCPLFPPLGKSSASSKIILPPISLEEGTGLFGCHGFTPLVPSWALYVFVL